mmetsp:Transcript_78390/g.217722  ORF Transcript_78390/g.217722 Transcript_78390/m.217722 type:complete len:209 (+) Transcript_78390:179-805(+)
MIAQSLVMAQTCTTGQFLPSSPGHASQTIVHMPSTSSPLSIFFRRFLLRHPVVCVFFFLFFFFLFFFLFFLVPAVVDVVLVKIGQGIQSPGCNRRGGRRFAIWIVCQTEELGVSIGFNAVRVHLKAEVELFGMLGVKREAQRVRRTRAKRRPHVMNNILGEKRLEGVAQHLIAGESGHLLHVVTPRGHTPLSVNADRQALRGASGPET